MQGGRPRSYIVPMAEGTLDKVPEWLADDANDHRVLPMTDVFPTAYHAVCGRGRAGRQRHHHRRRGLGLLAAHAAGLFDPANICPRPPPRPPTGGGTVPRRRTRRHRRGRSGGDDRRPDRRPGCRPHHPGDLEPGDDALRDGAAEPAGRSAGSGWRSSSAHPDIPWDKAFMKNATISGGVAPVKRYLPELWPLLDRPRRPVARADPRLPLEEGVDGYRIMDQREPGSVKVAVTPTAWRAAREALRGRAWRASGPHRSGTVGANGNVQKPRMRPCLAPSPSTAR